MCGKAVAQFTAVLNLCSAFVHSFSDVERLDRSFKVWDSVHTAVSAPSLQSQASDALSSQQQAQQLARAGKPADSSVPSGNRKQGMLGHMASAISPIESSSSLSSDAFSPLVIGKPDGYRTQDVPRAALPRSSALVSRKGVHEAIPYDDDVNRLEREQLLPLQQRGQRAEARGLAAGIGVAEGVPEAASARSASAALDDVTFDIRDLPMDVLGPCSEWHADEDEGAAVGLDAVNWTRRPPPSTRRRPQSPVPLGSWSVDGGGAADDPSSPSSAGGRGPTAMPSWGTMSRRGAVRGAGGAGGKVRWRVKGRVGQVVVTAAMHGTEFGRLTVMDTRVGALLGWQLRHCLACSAFSY